MNGRRNPMDWPTILLGLGLVAGPKALAGQTSTGVDVTIHGSILLNAWRNSGRTNNADVPTLALASDQDPLGRRSLGAAIRQTRIRIEARHESVLGGRLFGELDADFFGGQQPSSGGRTHPLLRLRRAYAVVWLEGARGAKAVDLEIVTQRKEFTPNILVAPLGSQVSFSNRDAFNHNVFSRSDEAPFDLGLYGRDQTRAVRLSKPGIARIYCNIHAQMWAVVVVVESPYVARPGGDGAFRIANVPPGSYRLQVWHERAGQATRTLEVGPAGVADLAMSLDASGFKRQTHLNKFGRPYDPEGRRY